MVTTWTAASININTTRPADDNYSDDCNDFVLQITPSARPPVATTTHATSTVRTTTGATGPRTTAGTIAALPRRTATETTVITVGGRTDATISAAPTATNIVPRKASGLQISFPGNVYCDKMLHHSPAMCNMVVNFAYVC